MKTCLQLIEKKTELFDSFFPKQCSVIKNSRSLLSGLLYKNDKSLSIETFNKDDILKINQNSDIGKAYDHYKITSIKWSINILPFDKNTVFKGIRILNFKSLNKLVQSTDIPVNIKKKLLIFLLNIFTFNTTK